MNFTFRQYL